MHPSKNNTDDVPSRLSLSVSWTFVEGETNDGETSKCIYVSTVCMPYHVATFWIFCGKHRNYQDENIKDMLSFNGKHFIL